MSQTINHQAINHVALKTLIQSILSSVLGTYTYSNGTTTPAIWVEGVPDSSGEKPQKTTGLEVVLVINSDSEYSPYMKGEYRLSQVSEVQLKQWDSTKDTNIARALLLANQQFQGLIEAVQPRVLPYAGFGNIEQQTILLRHF